MDSAASCHRAGFQRIAERKIIFMDIYRKDSMATLVKDNAYVGRGIVIGKTADAKKAAVAYFIMGRSENSRNRVFIEKGDEVIIEPFDVSKVEDPSLIIYSPIKKWENKLIVTNGDQTDTVYDFIKDGKTFEEALETREFEPDAPNFTPRISGMLTFGEFRIQNEYPEKRRRRRQRMQPLHLLLRCNSRSGSLHPYLCLRRQSPAYIPG